MAKMLAACRAFNKVDGIDAEVLRNTNIYLEKLDLISSAERQAARASKPWALRKKHAQEKVDHKERTTESAKKKLQCSEEELEALKERVAKERAEYHDRKFELGKSLDDMAVIISTKCEYDSSDDDDDDGDDESDNAEDMRGQIARLEQEAEASARLLASLRDDLREAGGKKRPPASSSAISIDSGDEREGDDHMAVDKQKRLVLGPSGAKLARSRRSRSRRHPPRIQKDDDVDAILDASGTGKVYPA